MLGCMLSIEKYGTRKHKTWIRFPARVKGWGRGNIYSIQALRRVVQ
jgi:hypothetical protein